MKRKFKYDVFLSYNFKDKIAVNDLAERLRKDGLRVWLDTWVIQPGDIMRGLEIQRGLERSQTFVLCMSPAYFNSEGRWLEQQARLFRDPTNLLRRFIPLLIEDCASDITYQYAYIDWRTRSDEGYGKLLATCRGEEDEKAKPKVPTEQINRWQVGLASRATRPSPIRSPKKMGDQMVLEGHTDAVWAVGLTPDGKTIVSSSRDRTLKIWDFKTGQCCATLKGHGGTINTVAITSDGKMVVSGSEDSTLKIWNLENGLLLFTYKGHTDGVTGVALTSDGKKIVSSSRDRTLKIWDFKTGQCCATFKGHTGDVCGGVVVTPDGKTVVSGSDDKTLKVWDLDTGRCRVTLEGHSGTINYVAITPDGRTVISASNDKTLKVWNLVTNRCFATFEGHTLYISAVAVTPNGKTIISGSADKTLKVWDLATGQCIATFKGHTQKVTGVFVTPDSTRFISSSCDNTLRVWELPGPDAIVDAADDARYTNAKVVLVGKTSVGKTGLALRLCENRWKPTGSTHGMSVSRLELPSGAGSTGMKRDVWLWDFAGQPDYRLIHQLYMDETSLGVLVFDPQDDDPFKDIGYWEKALDAATKYHPAKLLVAGRCDRGGPTISSKQYERYLQEHAFVGFLKTEAKTGDGCEELKAAIARNIPWERLPFTASSRLFKLLKDTIVKLTEEKKPLVRLSKLHQRLQLLLPREIIGEAELQVVIDLMQGQGVVQRLAFGEFVLLQPEYINRYASVVVRMARENPNEMGIVSERQVLDGHLDFKDTKRLSESDEKILLRAIVQIFLDRSLCSRQETPEGVMLVFPSYFCRDKPALPEYTYVFVTYGFAGLLDEIYATLVVRLSYSGEFKSDKSKLWKNAADFKTPEGKRARLALTKKTDSEGEIVIYFESGVPDDTKVTFIKYVHEHLLAKVKSPEGVTRVRTYVCPYCGEPLENRRVIQKRLEMEKKDIGCLSCDKRIPLLDLIEEKFASDKFLQRVRELDERAKINLDNETRELILVGHTIAIAAEAGQIFRPTVWYDRGIDGEIEFKNDKGQASGQRVYVQLKSGDSYLYQRRRDDVEVFTIKEARHAEYWLKQAYPVMLVIRTSDGNIRWMNVSDYLREHGVATRQIVFEGESFTALNVARLRDKVLCENEGK